MTDAQQALEAWLPKAARKCVIVAACFGVYALADAGISGAVHAGGVREVLGGLTFALALAGMVGAGAGMVWCMWYLDRVERRHAS